MDSYEPLQLQGVYTHYMCILNLDQFENSWSRSRSTRGIDSHKPLQLQGIMRICVSCRQVGLAL